jgi:ABC-type nitrate/sulfonate/bicarbonate transport system permease component
MRRRESPIVPVPVLLLGYGVLCKTTVVCFMTLFPILLNTTSGIRNVDNSLVRMVRSFGARDLKIFVGWLCCFLAYGHYQKFGG